MEIIIDIQDINFAPENEAAEIMQNVRTICSTIKGTVPLDREFGIDAAVVDMPVNVVQAGLSAQIIRAVREFEPRADVSGVAFRDGLSDGQSGLSDGQSGLPVVSIRPV